MRKPTASHLTLLVPVLLFSAGSLQPAAGAPEARAALPLVEAAGSAGLLLEDLALRPGVSVDLFVAVHGDIAAKHCQLAIHGGTYAAASWRPYAQALGSDHCVLAVDLPGRGGSSLPDGLSFGALDLDDYVTAVLRVLERLETLDIEPETILGHSMGGTLVQMLQQRLVAEGTNLEHRFDIREAILVAPDLPAEAPWALGDSGALSELIEAFAVEEPGLGTLFEIPPALWPAFFFTNLDGELVSGAPTPEEIVAQGYNALGEPLLAIHQLNGTGGFASRPSVDAGLFTEDTRLRLVTYEHDGFVRPNETEVLYTHLTGDQTRSCFVLVEGPGTVHSMQLSDPARLVDAIAGAADCAYGDGE